MRLTDATCQLLSERGKNHDLSITTRMLEAENAQLIDELNRLNQNVSSKEDELLHSRNEIDRLQKIKEDRDKMLQDMKQQNEKHSNEKKQELLNLKSRISELEEERREFEMKLSESKAALDIQVNSNEASTRDFFAVKAELQNLQQQLDMANEREKEAIGLAKKSKEEVAKALDGIPTKISKRCDQVRSELEYAHMIEVCKLRSDLKQANEENSILFEKFERCKNDCHAAEKKNNDINATLQQSLLDMDREEKQRAKLQVELQEVSCYISL